MPLTYRDLTRPAPKRSRRPTLVLTGHAMAAVAADLPPMGGGFPQRLIQKAQRLEVSHDSAGGVHFTLLAGDGAVLGAVDYHHEDARLPKAYHPPRKQAAAELGLPAC